MLRESLKWMLLALCVIGLIVAGAVFLVSGIRGARSAQPVEAHASAPASPAPTPHASGALQTAHTPLPTYTPTMTVPPPTPTVPVDAAEAFVRDTMARMPLEDKLGQLVMFGFSGTEGVSTVFGDIMAKYRVGNVILYGSNIVSGDRDGGFSRCKKLTRALNATRATDVPLLISTDVEGGAVVRFRWSPWPSSARTLGRRDDPDTAYAQFLSIADKLRSVGVNMDLAPVLDVAVSPMSTALKTRIISSSTDVTSRIGRSIIRGLRDGGCLSTAKHFPGHGGTNEDSHAVTPTVNRSADELFEYDLIPFAESIEEGVDAILIAHILYPQLDPTEIASLSPVIIGDLLRGQLGFEGVVISDDFRMTGLSLHCDVGTAAVRFLLAGGDMILCGAQHDKQTAIMEALIAAVNDGTLTPARIDESLYRILMKKVAVTDWYDG